MKRHLAVPGMVLIFLFLIDLAMATLLGLARDHGTLPSLQRYFDYGLSVPAKLDRWIADPDLPENLFDVAWIPDTMARSEQLFATDDPAPGALRGYGMSFLAQMMQAAADQDPALRIDLHGGPAAPPNFAYALFLNDRPNRRAGDATVLAILSSSLPGMAALSNRSWAFEQPAPATYPVFWPDGRGGLRAVEPLVRSASQERNLRSDPAASLAWRNQLAQEDAFYSPITFGLPLMDRSPLLRLIRRSWAVQMIDDRKAAMVDGDRDYPLVDALRTMVSEFSRIAREDGQIPIVYLIQGRDGRDADLLQMLEPVLREQQIPYLATETLADPRDPLHYTADGHFTASTNQILAEAFRQLLSDAGWKRFGPQAAETGRPGGTRPVSPDQPVLGHP